VPYPFDSLRKAAFSVVVVRSVLLSVTANPVFTMG
jgi:hypothetical protein